jgi:hypothetical protein
LNLNDYLFFQIIINDIKVVKIIIIRSKHQKLNPKLNASHFGSNNILYIGILYPKRPKRGSLYLAFTLNLYVLSFFCFCFASLIPFDGYKVNFSLIHVDNQTWRYVVHFNKVSNMLCAMVIPSCSHVDGHYLIVAT